MLCLLGWWYQRLVTTPRTEPSATRRERSQYKRMTLALKPAIHMPLRVICSCHPVFTLLLSTRSAANCSLTTYDPGSWRPHTSTLYYGQVSVIIVQAYVVAYRSITQHPTCDNANHGERLTVGCVGGDI
jgi:hypothetical protein